MEYILEFTEQPYARMKFVNLKAESEEIKWKMLEWHNQPHILTRIVNRRPFTVEEHKKFLDSLPDLNWRNHYVVYFDGKPVGKVTINTPVDGVINDTGDYLFSAEDMLTGVGILERAFLHRVLYEVYDARKVETLVCIDNRNSWKTWEFFGNKRVREDKMYYYYEGRPEWFAEARPDIDELIAGFFYGRE